MKRAPLLFLLLLFAFLPGCISYTTLQTPETLSPGDVSVGVGAAVGQGAMFEVGGRVGVVKNVDAGLKVALPRLIFADTKVQLTDGPLFVAGDLGFSYMKNEEESDAISSSSYGLYPMLLVGGENWYVGGKGIYFWTEGSADILGNLTFTGSGWLGPAAVAGVWLGNEDFKVLLEGNAFFFRGSDPLFLGGVGIQFTF